jgi:PTH2 family peptidyl-tRNA hydrolase
MNKTKTLTKLVTVMRTDLGLSKGKLVSAGACVAIKAYKDAAFSHLMAVDLSAWLGSGTRQICLRADSLSELETLKSKANLRGLLCHSVNTEEGELLCISIGPAADSIIDEVTGNLRLM